MLYFSPSDCLPLLQRRVSQERHCVPRACCLPRPSGDEPRGAAGGGWFRGSWGRSPVVGVGVRRGPGSSTGSTSCNSAHVPRAEGPGSCWAARPAPTSQPSSPNTLASGTDAGDGSRTGCPDYICPRYKLRSPSGDKLHMREGVQSAHSPSGRTHSLTHRGHIHLNHNLQDSSYRPTGPAKQKLMPPPGTQTWGTHTSY